MDPHLVVRFIECHPGLAGWLQAVFSVLAIVAAILISWQTVRSDRRARKIERSHRSEGFLLLVMADVMLLKGLIEQRWNALDHIKQKPLQNWKLALERLKLPISDRLSSSMSLTLDMDGQVIDPIRGLLTTVFGFNGFISSIEGCFPELEESAWPELHERISNTLTVARKCAADVERVYEARYGATAVANIVRNTKGHHAAP